MGEFKWLEIPGNRSVDRPPQLSAIFPTANPIDIDASTSWKRQCSIQSTSWHDAPYEAARGTFPYQGPIARSQTRRYSRSRCTQLGKAGMLGWNPSLCGLSRQNEIFPVWSWERWRHITHSHHCNNKLKIKNIRIEENRVGTFYQARSSTRRVGLRLPIFSLWPLSRRALPPKKGSLKRERI